jgi:hypothetical protein
VFALSATPKVVFHEILAEHTDGPVCHDRNPAETHFHQPAFHCAFDDLVVSSPFLLFTLNEAPEPTVLFPPFAISFIAPDVLRAFLHSESRGPPLT